MSVSVIIPVKNGAGIIRRCLESVYSQDRVGSGYEVIVVDDGSTDDTAAMASKMGARVVSQKNAGPASARNTGARVAKGDILAFTDVDCAPGPCWLYHLTAPLENTEVVGVKGTYCTDQYSLVSRFVQQEYESKYRRMAHQENIDFIDTYSAAYRRDVFLANGGFETAFPVPSVEDQEFSFRLARKGYRMVFAPQAEVYHLHDRDIWEYTRRKYFIGYWKAFMLRWVPEKALSDSHTLSSQRWQILFLALAVFLLGAGLFWFPAIWMGLAALSLFYLSSVPFLLQIAQNDPKVLWVSPLMLFLRSAAQITGLAAGFVSPPKTRPRASTGLHLPARFLKRTMDLIGAGLGLIISLPMILLAGLAIKIEDGGPVFFYQERAGENGKPFRMIKLRTMVVGAEKRVQEVIQLNALSGPVYKIPNDPRVTKTGRRLRRWSIDEVPQFWNVLRGDMSLVGPRPEETWVVARYDDNQRQRLAVKPGLTGPMQVNGRGDMDFSDRLKTELDYINHYTIWKDIAILLRSIPAIFWRQGGLLNPQDEAFRQPGNVSTASDRVT